MPFYSCTPDGPFPRSNNVQTKGEKLDPVSREKFFQMDERRRQLGYDLWKEMCEFYHALTGEELRGPGRPKKETASRREKAAARRAEKVKRKGAWWQDELLDAVSKNFPKLAADEPFSFSRFIDDKRVRLEVFAPHQIPRDQARAFFSQAKDDGFFIPVKVHKLQNQHPLYKFNPPS